MIRASEVKARLGSMIAVQCSHPNVLVVLQLSYLDARNNNIVGTLQACGAAWSRSACIVLALAMLDRSFLQALLLPPFLTSPQHALVVKPNILYLKCHMISEEWPLYAPLMLLRACFHVFLLCAKGAIYCKGLVPLYSLFPCTGFHFV